MFCSENNDPLFARHHSDIFTSEEDDFEDEDDPYAALEEGEKGNDRSASMLKLVSSALVRGGGRKRRKRTTPEQLSILEGVFGHNPYPNQSLRAKLALKLKMRPNNVHKWFQNRRFKCQRLARANQNIGGSSSSTTNEKTSPPSLSSASTPNWGLRSCDKTLRSAPLVPFPCHTRRNCGSSSAPSAHDRCFHHECCECPKNFFSNFQKRIVSPFYPTSLDNVFDPNMLLDAASNNKAMSEPIFREIENTSEWSRLSYRSCPCCRPDPLSCYCSSLHHPQYLDEGFGFGKIGTLSPNNISAVLPCSTGSILSSSSSTLESSSIEEDNVSFLPLSAPHDLFQTQEAQQPNAQGEFFEEYEEGKDLPELFSDQLFR